MVQASKTKLNILTIAFLLVQAALYALILTTDGNLLVVAEYTAIVLCFIFAVLHIKKCDFLLIAGLGFTVVADYFLVVASPQQKLWGMIAFLITQTFYAVALEKVNSGKASLFIRLGLTALGILFAVILLGKNTDALALVSICYYINLIMNIVVAFKNFSQNRLFAIGLVFFLFCDTVIGLQVASSGYLPIAEGSLLYKIIFAPFHLSWFFYLPSQVLIALSAVFTCGKGKGEL